MNNKHRIFIAINLVDEIKQNISKIIDQLAQNNRGKAIKWVDYKLLHITLHFLGGVDDKEIEAVDKVLVDFVKNFKQTKLTFVELDIFPNQFNPRVICLKTKEIDDKILSTLQKELGKELEYLGFEIDHRLWTSHITLGRVKDSGVKKINLDVKLEGLENKIAEIKSIELMESELTPVGPIYKIIKSYKLVSTEA